MSRRHHYKRRTKEAAEIDVTTFLNLMVVLVPFLLITAVFSRLSIVELNLPSSAGGPSRDVPFTVEVVVREAGLEITNGTSVIAAIPNVDGAYNLQSLSDHMIELKREYPDHETASVLLEPQIPYDYLIQVMDVVRSVTLPSEDGQEFELYSLFAQISVGDAP
jgi:biopolymer transport protein ExbD